MGGFREDCQSQFQPEGLKCSGQEVRRKGGSRDFPNEVVTELCNTFTICFNYVLRPIGIHDLFSSGHLENISE